MHVEHESVFYQSGALQVYDLKCELFEYSNERFTTGISEIDDAYEDNYTANTVSLTSLYEQDIIAKNIFYENEANNIIDFSEINPFEEVITTPSN